MAWLLDLLDEIGLLEATMAGQLSLVQLWGDNKAANLLCTEDSVIAGNQHTAVLYHQSKGMQRLGKRNTDFVRNQDNCADLFTKNTS